MICSICLEAVQKPVVTPCGHIFCFKCLVLSSLKSPDATKAPCPTCRASFNLVIPDPAFVPEKYRSFINSNVRRVYLDDSQEVALRQKVARLESRVKSLETDKTLLMTKCVSHMAAATSHAQGEREARLRCVKLQEELTEAKRAKVVGTKIQSTSPSLSVTPAPPLSLSVSPAPPPRAPRISLPGTDNPRLLGKRDSDATSGTQASTESYSKPFRPLIPLPKRRRVLNVPQS